MAILNYGNKELICKIVYYGPAFGGKTTNLQQVHQLLPADKRSNLTSLATSQDRTLYFDLLPLDFGRIGDYYVKLQMYTVPGQVQYNATRKLVLNGVDGIVMVFDSDPSREDANYLSFANLEENLESFGVSTAEIPTVLQYNKRDLPDAMDLEFMSNSLNPDGIFREVEASALKSEGVQETLRLICRAVFDRLESEMPRRDGTSVGVRPLADKRTRGASKPEPPKEKAAEKSATSPDSSDSPLNAIRQRQLSEMRMGGLKIGQAIWDLVPGGRGPGSPDYSVLVDLRPMVGSNRLEKVQFWSEPGDPGQGDVEKFVSRSDERETRILWRIAREGVPAELYLAWDSRFGRISIVPPGRSKLPEAA